MRKYNYKMNDLIFKTKPQAIISRKLLNLDAKRGDINLQQRVLRGKRGWLVRGFSLRRILR